MELTHQRLTELLDYCAETGVFRWRQHRRKCPPGTIAGSKGAYGYNFVRVDYRRYAAHRLAWFWVHGVWPNGEIDHINHVRDDNRLENLRLANSSQNKHNALKKASSTSGYKGVHFHKTRQKWQARIRKDYTRHFLGWFDTPEEAAQAYDEAALRLHGPYACTNAQLAQAAEAL